ncbi:hypothetical protein DVA81_19175, partial [Acinetobacter baumannii]
HWVDISSGKANGLSGLNGHMRLGEILFCHTFSIALIMRGQFIHLDGFKAHAWVSIGTVHGATSLGLRLQPKKSLYGLKHFLS